MTLLEQHYDSLAKMIGCMASSFCHNSGEEFHDLLSEGWMGVWNAELKFDAALNVPFYAFARVKALGAMRDYLRRIDPLTREQRKRVHRVEDCNIKIVCIDHALHISKGWDSGAFVFKAVEEKADVDSLMRKAWLNKRESYVVRQRMNGVLNKDTAKEFGVNESRAHQIWESAVRKMRRVA